MNEIKNQPEALRLAHLLELDKWPDAAEELRRLHARVRELESIERQLCEQADVAANAYRELQSEAANNARIICASAEIELALRARVEELGRELAAIGAGGVEPLRKSDSLQAVQAVTMPAAQGLDAQTIKHISALSELVRMPNAEYFADAHNAAVRHLRAIAAQAKKGG